MEKTALVNPWLDNHDEDPSIDIDDVETADFFEEMGEEVTSVITDYNCYRSQGPKVPLCSGERMGLLFVVLLLLSFAGGIALMTCSSLQCMGLGRNKSEQSTTSEAIEGRTIAPTPSTLVVAIHQNTPSPVMQTIVTPMVPMPSISVTEMPALASATTSTPFLSTVQPTTAISDLASRLPTSFGKTSELPPSSPMPTVISSFATPALVSQEESASPDSTMFQETATPSTAISSATIQPASPSDAFVAGATATPTFVGVEQPTGLGTRLPTSTMLEASNRTQSLSSLTPSPTPVSRFIEPASQTPALVGIETSKTSDPSTITNISTTVSPSPLSNTIATNTSQPTSAVPTTSPSFYPTTIQPSFAPSTLAPSADPTKGSKSSKNDPRTHIPTVQPTPLSLTPAPVVKTPLKFIPLVAAPTLIPTFFRNTTSDAAAPTSIPVLRASALGEATAVPAAVGVDPKLLAANSTALDEPSIIDEGRLIFFPFLAERYHGDTLVSTEHVNSPAHYQATGLPDQGIVTLRYTSLVHVVKAPVPLVMELWYGWESVDVWVDNAAYDATRLLEEGSHAVLIECRGKPGHGIEFNAAMFLERILYTAEDASYEIRAFLNQHAAHGGEEVRVVTVNIAGSNDPYLETLVDGTSYDSSGHKVFLVLTTLSSVNWVVAGSSVIGVAYSYQPASKVHGVDWSWPVLDLQFLDDLDVWGTAFAGGMSPDQAIDLSSATDVVVL